MGGNTDRDLEELLRRGVKPDPAHKRALRERLFSMDRELSLDELDAVTGGGPDYGMELQLWPKEPDGRT